jgi:hypothetical protein
MPLSGWYIQEVMPFSGQYIQVKIGSLTLPIISTNDAILGLPMYLELLKRNKNLK